MSDLIRREDAIKAIHNYWKKRLDTLPTKESQYGEVYADIQQMNKILEHNKTLCNFINAIPSADRPSGEWIHNPNGIDRDFIWWKCSKCGHVIYSESEHDREEFHAFCGRCGARMKGADDE